MARPQVLKRSVVDKRRSSTVQYQNNLNSTAFFCTFFKGYRYNLSSCNNTKDYFFWEPNKINVKFHQNCETTCKILKISCVRCHIVKFDVCLTFDIRTPVKNFVWYYYRYLTTFVTFQKCKKECDSV